VRAGAMFSIAAAIAGWRLASSAEKIDASPSLEWHRWLGTIAAVAVLGAALATAGGDGRFAIRPMGLPDHAVLGGGARRHHRSSRRTTRVGQGLPASVNEEECV